MERVTERLNRFENELQHEISTSFDEMFSSARMSGLYAGYMYQHEIQSYDALQAVYEHYKDVLQKKYHPTQYYDDVAQLEADINELLYDNRIDTDHIDSRELAEEIFEENNGVVEIEFAMKHSKNIINNYLEKGL